MFPVIAEFDITSLDIPYSVQIARQNSMFKLFRPRVFAILLALTKFEHSGAITEPGRYALVMKSWSRAELYKAGPGQTAEHTGEVLLGAIHILRLK